MRLTITAVVYLMILILGFGDRVTAQEWSDPIQLTDTEGLWMSSPMFLFIDTDDVLHVAYMVDEFEFEYGNKESFYQKFSRTGEPLMDPIPVTIASGIPDSTAYLIIACLDSNGFFHLIWRSRATLEYGSTAFYTKFNSEGDVVLGPIIMPEFAGTASGDITNLVVDSNGELIIGGGGVIRQDTIYVRAVYYQRYNEDIEIIGETHRLDHDRRAIRDQVRMRIIAGDTLLFVWRQNRNLHNSVHFSKVAPDDEIIIDDELLLPRDDWGSLGFSGPMTVDNNSNLIIPISQTRDDYLYIRKYDSSLNEIYQTRIADRYDSDRDLCADNNNYIHHIGDYRPPDRRRSLIYFLLDEEGNFIDSSEIVFEHPIRAENWNSPQLFSCEDGFTGLVWLQDLAGGGNHRELLLSYKYSNRIPDNIDHYPLTNRIKLYPNYPDPFNSKTNIPFYIPVNFSGRLMIHDVLGRIVYKQDMSGYSNGRHILNWMGMDNKGEPLPSGIYLVQVTSQNKQATEKVLLIR